MARLGLVLVFCLAMLGGSWSASAQGTAQRREILPENIAPPTVVVTPLAAERIVELMTVYTLTVAGGLATGGLLTSMITSNVVGITLGSILGAALAVGGYGMYVSGHESVPTNSFF